MASRAETSYKKEITQIGNVSKRELEAFFDALDLDDADSARDALLEFMPAHVRRWGDLNAATAADFYDTQRAAARVPQRFSAVMAKLPDDAVIQERVRYGAGHLYTDTPIDTLAFLESAASGYISDAARDTIYESGRQDPAKPYWEVVVDGNACDYCQERDGIVFEGANVEFGSFHDNCNCQVVPGWS